jgi:hypothetical protein
MIDKTFLDKTTGDEISVKIQAIHAYDKIVWTVRSGFLTLVFGGWGFIINQLLMY